MAQRTVVTLLDDMNGRDITDEGSTVRFGIDGVDYEIDLGDKNAAKLRKVLEPFVAKARRIGTSRKVSVSTRPASPVGSNAAIREWGRENGYEVSNRGRIAAKVVTAYEKANRLRSVS